ncbi:MAG: hypothetical protein ACRC0L_02980 [Angustibacter sp.]
MNNPLLPGSPRGASALNALAICTVVGALALSGACSRPQKQSAIPPSKYHQDILLAAKKVPTEFQRKLLEDGEITRAEYEQAVDRTIKCVAEKGFRLGKISDPGGYYTFGMEASDAGDKAYSECGRQYSSKVEFYYMESRRNPDRRDFNELTAECLRRKKAAPANYTGAQFAADLEKAMKGSKFLPETPQWQACLSNPVMP